MLVDRSEVKLLLYRKRNDKAEGTGQGRNQTGYHQHVVFHTYILPAVSIDPANKDKTKPAHLPEQARDALLLSRNPQKKLKN